MGIEALTHRDDGIQVAVPASQEDWQQWVSAGRTRNWMLQDPLVDWLHLYNKDRAYIPKSALEGYDRNLDFVQFIFERAGAFEAGILRLLQRCYEVVTVAHGPSDIRQLPKAQETFSHMQAGAPIIYQGVLWDAHQLTYGSPDFLIRSDVLNQLFPASFADSIVATPAPDLGDINWHYCVVDTKFTTLHFSASETELLNGGSAKAYKAQLFIYNRMLGRLQGYEPPQSFLLGRGWEFESKGVKSRSSNAFDRLGPVEQHGTITGSVPLADEVGRALNWVRRVRTDGHKWEVLPRPTVPELYPNVGGADDELVLDVAEPDGHPDEEEPHRWVSVKKWLASELKELTQLWQVGPGKRDEALSAGVYRWDDPKLNPAIVGVTGAKRAPTLQEIIAVNTTFGGVPVRRAALRDTSSAWRNPMPMEFYVDFEYCNDLNDNFTNLPEKGGQPLIFMIGCGHLEEDTWLFRSFVVKELSEPEELRIIQEWTAHMEEVQERLGVVSEAPRVFHWSHAEVTALESAYNSARARQSGHASWPTAINWYDFLVKVMREEPIVVRGALGFGLKAVANAMYDKGLIATNWADSPVDGLGAMVGAWRCDEKRQETGTPLHEMSLMQEIARYNEVDCKVMMEIISYLRTNH